MTTDNEPLDLLGMLRLAKAQYEETLTAVHIALDQTLGRDHRTRDDSAAGAIRRLAAKGRFPRSTDPAPDGTCWEQHEDISEWVDKLPPTRHVPSWDGLSSHPGYLCAACSMREEGVTYAWPCKVAVEHGADIARTYGWEAAT